jgi:hypothetical protein
MKSKLVSIEEANRMLPLLRSIVEDIRYCWEQIIAKRTRLEVLEKGPEIPEVDKSEAAGEEVDVATQEILDVKAELNRLIERINNYIREVEDLGCFVEEFKRGIINFPSLYHGRKVFLCWGLGEESVGRWHELDESFNDGVKIHDASQFLNTDPKVKEKSEK